MRKQCTFEELDFLSSCLHYRASLVHTAVSVVTVMALDPFIPFHEWDGKYKGDDEYEIHDLVLAAGLFPRSNIRSEGHDYNKPFNYVTAAFIDKGIGPDDARKRLSIARQCTQPPA